MLRLLFFSSYYGLRLLRSVIAPPFVTDIVIDPVRGRAYLAAREHGLWRLDLKRLRERPQSAPDPFYKLLNLLSNRAQRLLGWPSRIPDELLPQPRIELGADCPG
ncbi:MAG: hypothetical protein P9M14_06165 [Candidatus Alcyoniella australis]|nr:hypothetical protein [Candidatus Alcyoniella australis]